MQKIIAIIEGTSNEQTIKQLLEKYKEGCIIVELQTSQLQEIQDRYIIEESSIISEIEKCIVEVEQSALNTKWCTENIGKCFIANIEKYKKKDSNKKRKKRVTKSISSKYKTPYISTRHYWRR